MGEYLHGPEVDELFSDGGEGRRILLDGLPTADELNADRIMPRRPHEVVITGKYILGPDLDTQYAILPATTAAIRALSCMKPGEQAVITGFAKLGIINPQLEGKPLVNEFSRVTTQLGRPLGSGDAPLIGKVRRSRLMRYWLREDIVFVDAPERTRFGAPLGKLAGIVGKAILTGAAQPGEKASDTGERSSQKDFSARQAKATVAASLVVAANIGEEWVHRAACRKTDPETFFSDFGKARAKAICAGCVVRAECLEGALDRQEKYGVWGGLTGRERNKLIKR